MKVADQNVGKKAYSMADRVEVLAKQLREASEAYYAGEPSPLSD